MTRNFVIAFGGTGARCVEALTYLYASRALANPANILLIDPDAQNGNVGVTRNQLLRYHTIQQQVEGDSGSPSAEAGKKPFFSVALNQQPGLEGFVWGYPNPNQPFSTLIAFASQQQGHQRLLELLFDEQDFALQFDRGYVGHAHIGSLDLVRTLKHAIEAAANEDNRSERDALQTFFRTLRAAAHSDGANLFIIGSVFGGTGASGIPAIPALVNEVMHDLRSKINLGCVQVGPYFSFPKSDRDRAPDSARHALATQAALYHYAATETGYHRIYFVGSPRRDETNSHHATGGSAQSNRAHYVELAAALAAGHFLEGSSTTGNTDVFTTGATAVTWNKLPHPQAARLRRTLVSFATFCELYSDFLSDDLTNERHRRARWTFDLWEHTRQTLGGREKELVALKEFSDRFLQWVIELQQTAGVQLFSIEPADRRSDRNLATVTEGARVGVSARKPFFALPEGQLAAYNPYHFIVDRINRSRRVDQSSPTGWYIETLTRSVDEFCAVNYESWWGKDEH